MSNQTQQQIDTLIQIINDAEEPGTVTNLIVAAVLAFLADKVKTMATASALSAEVSALETVDASLNQAIQNEATARQAADTTLSDRISALQVALDRLMSGNVSDAIESFNEVISFLEEVTDDESLTGLLTAIDNRLNGVDEDLENKAGLHSNTGKVIYGQMPDVVLASMGFNLDNINAPSGTGIQYVPSYGDYYFDTNDNHIKYVDTGAIRDLNKPEPGLIYCNMKTNLTYRWIGSSWQPVGSSSNVDVVNGLNSTDGTKALSAAQGNVLKLKINEVYQALQSVYSLLGCAAFWGEKSPVTTVLPDLNWNSTMFTVTINKVNSNIAVKRGGIPVTGSSFQAEEGTSVTLTFEGSNTYEVLSVTVNGTAVQKVNGVFTYSFVVNGNTALEIDGTGSIITTPITVTVNAVNCTASPSSATVTSGGSFTCQLTPNTGCSLPVTVSYGNGLTAAVDGNGQFTINNITADIVVTAEAQALLVMGYLLHGDSHVPYQDPDWCYTRLIPVEAGDVIYWDSGYNKSSSYESNWEASALLYDNTANETDKSQGFLSRAATARNRSVQITVPSGAAYVRVSLYVPKLDSLCCYNTTQHTYIYKGPNHSGFDNWIWRMGMKFNQGTDPVADNTLCVSDYFAIPQGCSRLEYGQGSSNTDTFAYAYDENKNIVGERFKVPANSWRCTLDVPTGAAYIRTTVTINGLQSVFVFDIRNQQYLWRGADKATATEDASANSE